MIETAVWSAIGITTVILIICAATAASVCAIIGIVILASTLSEQLAAWGDAWSYRICMRKRQAGGGTGPH